MPVIGQHAGGEGTHGRLHPLGAEGPGIACVNSDISRLTLEK